MAYRVKYRFVFASQNGADVEIQILKNYQQGEPIYQTITRPLGAAPVLKMRDNGPIRGTSLDFLAECKVESEFAELYTSNPKDYQIALKRNNVTVWSGYIVPELYSEPDVAPPYDVQITATDGLGDLKLYDYTPQGAVTLRAQLQYLLGLTGLSTDINLISGLAATLPVSVAKSYLLDRPALNLDYMAGRNCYEVLTHILESLHAVLFWRRGVWWLVRETDIVVSELFGLRYTSPAGGTSYNTEAVKTAGQLGVADLWPVGYGTTTIEPAKKSITVQAPWHPTTPLKNAEMDTPTYWDYDITAGTSFDLAYKCFFALNRTITTCAISQTVTGLKLPLPISISARVSGTPNAPLQVTANLLIQAKINGAVVYTAVRDNQTGRFYWFQGEGTAVTFSQTVESASFDGSIAETVQVDLPPLLNLNGEAIEHDLYISISGSRYLRIYSAGLEMNPGAGYQTRVKINNGARGSADMEEITGGRVSALIDSIQPFMQGLYVYNGSALATWKTDRLTTAADLLTIMAQDYALSIAAPRLTYRATLNSPTAVNMVPIILTKAGITYFVRSFEWNLFDDEISVEAISLPSVELTIESQVVEPITE